MIEYLQITSICLSVGEKDHFVPPDIHISEQKIINIVYQIKRRGVKLFPPRPCPLSQRLSRKQSLNRGVPACRSYKFSKRRFVVAQEGRDT